MKTMIISSVILFSNLIFLQAQDSLTTKRVNPQFWLRIYNDSTLQGKTSRMMCRLYEVKDSSLLVSKTSRLADYRKGNFEIMTQNYGMINYISYRNSNNVFLGMVLGGLSGLAVGAVVGQREEDDPEGAWFYMSAQEKAAGDMISCTLIGIGIGALLGTIKMTIPIHGRHENYMKSKKDLEKISVKIKYLSGD